MVAARESRCAPRLRASSRLTSVSASEMKSHAGTSETLKYYRASRSANARCTQSATAGDNVQPSRLAVSGGTRPRSNVEGLTKPVRMSGKRSLRRLDLTRFQAVMFESAGRRNTATADDIFSHGRPAIFTDESSSESATASFCAYIRGGPQSPESECRRIPTTSHQRKLHWPTHKICTIENGPAHARTLLDRGYQL